MQSLKLESEVQRIILRACLESGGFVALASLAGEVEEVVKYRAAAALSQNAKLLESKGIIERRVEGRRVYVKIKPAYVEEARRALKVLVKYHTPGDVAAMGVESADPRVVRENNLGVMPGDALKAIRIVNEVGASRGHNGMPELLPGINFVLGLKGETRETYRLNLEFLRTILEERLLVRRVNVRQVLVLPHTPMWHVGARIMARHKKYFRAFKRRVREEFDKPMLARVVPKGTILRALYVEAHEGKYSLARQVGSYPLLVYVTESIRIGEKLDVVVVEHGYRSVKGIPYPLNANTASRESLSYVPGLSRGCVLEILKSRPFESIEELANLVEEDVLKYLKV